MVQQKMCVFVKCVSCAGTASSAIRSVAKPLPVLQMSAKDCGLKVCNALRGTGRTPHRARVTSEQLGLLGALCSNKHM
jgi:hypothetical protein